MLDHTLVYTVLLGKKILLIANSYEFYLLVLITEYLFCTFYKLILILKEVFIKFHSSTRIFNHYSNSTLVNYHVSFIIDFVHFAFFFTA